MSARHHHSSSSLPSCFRPPTTTEPPLPPPSRTAKPNLTTCLYHTQLGLFSLTWSRTFAGNSLHLNLHPSAPNPLSLSLLQFHLKIKPFLFWKKQGSKKIASSAAGIPNSYVFWDLSNAKFGSGPEPESGFYIASPTASSLAPRRLTSSSPSSTTTSSDSSQKLSRLSFSLHRLQLLASSCSPPLRSSSPSYHPPPLQPSIAKPEPLSPFRHHHHPFPASVTKKSASSPNFQTHLFRRFDSPFIFQIHRIHHTDSPPISSSASSHLLKSQIHINHPPLTGATSRESTGTCFGVRLPSSNNPGVNSDLLPPTAFRNHLQSVASCHRCFEP